MGQKPADGVLLALVATLLLAAGLPQGGRAQIDALRNYQPSPQAASLLEAEDVPVDHHTGNLKFSRMLYSVKTPALELPITLSHHGGAVKPTDRPSWVGLGWTLNAGGVITRSMRGGLPDEASSGYAHRGDELYQEYNSQVSGAALDNPQYDVDALAGVSLDFLTNEIDGGNIDRGPDHFSYRFANRSGKLLIDPVGTSGNFEGAKIRTIPMRDLRIDYQGTKWTITTEEGTKYVFGDLDSSDNQEEGVEETIYENKFHQPFTAWYLTKVVPATGQGAIRLHYKRKTPNNSAADQKFVSPISQRETLSLDGSQECDELTPSRNMSKETRHRAWRLSEITTAREIIEFGSSYRKDMVHPDDGSKQAYKLDHIKVYSNDSGGLSEDETKGALKRQIDFSYSYFETTAVDGKRDKNKPRVHVSGKRLRLDSVHVVGGNDIESRPPFRFSYWEESHELPEFYTRNVDHWGYPNGAFNQEDIIPTTEVSVLGSSQTIGTANRSASKNIEDVRPGALKKVEYPNGGYTLFEYELDDYGYKEYTPINLEGTEVINSLGKKMISWGDSHDSWKKTKEVALSGPDTSTAEQMVLDISWTHPELYEGDDCSSGSQITCARVEVIDETTGNVKETIKSTNQDNDGDGEVEGNVTKEIDIDPSHSYSLKLVLFADQYDGGSYTCNDPNFTSVYCNIKAYVDWVRTNTEKKKVGGGIRVKRIERDDGNSSTPKEIRRFRYREADEPKRSSGVLVTTPRYEYNTNLDVMYVTAGGAYDGNTCGIISVGGSSVVPLSKSKGSAVGYKRVTALHGPKGAAPGGGKTIYEFTSPLLDEEENYHLPPIDHLPFGLQVTRSWKYGLPTQTVQSSDGGSLLRKTTTDQLMTSEENPPSEPQRFRRILGLHVFGLSDGDVGSDAYWLGWYGRSTGFTHPDTVTVTRYDSDGSVSISKTTNFDYKGQNHLNLTKKNRSTSNGLSRTTRYRYAHEEHSGMGPEGTHQLSQKYRTTVFKDEDGDGQVDDWEKVLKRSWTRWMNNSYGHWVPKSEWVWNDQ